MMTTLSGAIATARLSWQCNYTVGDEKWRLKQLHHLYQLLLDNRDELVELVAKARSSAPELYEKEFALLVSDLGIHISNVTGSKSKQVKSSQLGEAEISSRPVGVSLIVSGTDNPFRFMLAPLAASIAAGNVTILAVAAAAAAHSEQFISLLAREWTKYLDRDCNFLVPTFPASELEADKVDLITIYDTSPDQYHSVLSSSNTRLYNTATGYNLALITEGKKDWTQIVSAVAPMLRDDQALWSDRLHAVFVRKEDLASLQKSLGIARKDRTASTTTTTTTTVLDITLQEHEEFDLAAHLEASKKTGSLLMICVQSIERAVDAMIECSSPIQQLALLGPEAQKMAKFVQTWVIADVLSIGFVYPVAASSSSLASPLVSSATFARQLIITKKGPASLPSTTSKIRASYRNLIPPLKSEPRGEHIGFFTQVEYLVKGAGAVLGILNLVGLYYGIRWVKTKVLSSR